MVHIILIIFVACQQCCFFFYNNQNLVKPNLSTHVLGRYYNPRLRGVVPEIIFLDVCADNDSGRRFCGIIRVCVYSYSQNCLFE